MSLGLLYGLTRMSRTPHGVRGLKSTWSHVCVYAPQSHPSRGAWIEISSTKSQSYDSGRTPHGVRGLKLTVLLLLL